MRANPTAFGSTAGASRFRPHSDRPPGWRQSGRALSPRPGQPDGGEPRGPGAPRADDERAGQTEDLDENQARGERSDDRPDRVRGIELSERRAEVAVSGQVTGQGWQGGAHQDGRRRQGENRQAKAHQGEELRRPSMPG